MVTDALTAKINGLVSASFGFGFRTDWCVEAVRENSFFNKILQNHRIVLERCKRADIVACVPTLLPQSVLKPAIVARISANGSKLVASRPYKRNAEKYAAIYKANYGYYPKITIFEEDFFLETLRSYGRDQL